ncbi:hypothetical protein C0Q96_20330 [Streptomyces albidoflavus]|nr:hypothetical protein C0Q96_20330 [Streptomyces albidoflavus]
MPPAARASWGFLGLLLLGVSAYAITYGATRLGLLGQRQEARVMECSVQGGRVIHSTPAGTCGPPCLPTEWAARGHAGQVS